MKDWDRLQPAIAHAAKTTDRNVSLEELAQRVERSPFHAHRELREVLHETPKQFTLRIRLGRAASELVTSTKSILDIALEFGFENHETFSRAFQKRFQLSPSSYRKRGVSGDAATHATFANEIAPCIGLYHTGYSKGHPKEHPMPYNIQTEERSAQPILVVRRKVRPSEIAATIGAELPKVFLHAQRRGIAVSGFPITRYSEMSMGSLTIEPGMRVSQPAGTWTGDQGEGEVLAETLPSGTIAVTIHSGPYDTLRDAYGALEAWIAENGYTPNGAPWEAYLTDPTEHANPADWKTEVCWPIK